MKSIDGPTGKRLIGLVLLVVFMLYCGYVYYYNYTYKNITVELKKNTTVEYGSDKFNIKKVIKNINGDIIKVNNKVDTSILGAQEVVLDVKKGLVTKKIPIIVSVVDVTAPVINLKSEVVKVTKGDYVNLNDNVLSVVDEIDGNIAYSENKEDDNIVNYNIVYSDDINAVGTHSIVIEATDSYGNIATANYTLEVQELTPYQKTLQIHYNLPANVHGSSLVNTAYSLLGKPYGHANGPDVFDCSGFVQYVYSTVGISVSRSTSTQLYDGRAVSRNDMQPGDIICWGYGGSVSHTALYVGNGQMIHAANPSQGVILSNVAGWERGSGSSIISIRRI